MSQSGDETGVRTLTDLRLERVDLLAEGYPAGQEITIERAAGLVAYDLEPPAQMPLGEFQPMRHPGRTPLRPRYAPPPLPEDRVRVVLGDDYYTGEGWYEWTARDSDSPWDVHDISSEQRDRWAKAEADYQAMQAEIEALMEARHGEPDWPNVPPGWQQKPFMPVRP